MSRLPPLVTVAVYVDLAFLGLLCIILIMAILSGGAWAFLPCLAFGGLACLYAGYSPRSGGRRPPWERGG